MLCNLIEVIVIVSVMCVLVLFYYLFVISGECYLVIKYFFVYEDGLVIEVCVIIVFGLLWFVVIIIFFVGFIFEVSR